MASSPATPTLSCCRHLGLRYARPRLERIDLNRHRVQALGCNCCFPGGHVGEVYYFDPIGDDDLRRLRQQGRDLLAVLGAPAAAAAAGTLGSIWRVASTSSDSFGEEVPPALLGDPEQFVQAPAGGYELYSCGFAYIDDSWTSSSPRATTAGCAA